MGNSTYKKLLNLKLHRNLLTSHLHETLEKGFKIKQYSKIWKFEGDWDNF